MDVGTLGSGCGMKEIVMAKTGAPAAYRGYRLQILYTLDRMLGSFNAPTQVFHLEGVEDLDILENGVYRELIQVKSSPNLSLADLVPQRPDSFFHRVLAQRPISESATISLVSFGSFGTELLGAWKRPGQERDRVRRKLAEMSFTDADIDFLFTHIRLEPVCETDIVAGVMQRLRDQFTGIDPKAGYDLLAYWLYRQAEQSNRVVCQQLIERISNVARFLAEREAHHQEWFVSIVPLYTQPASGDQQKALEKEFLEGVDARYEHIVAGLDYGRGEKLDQIYAAFRRTKVVIVHGVSGQGKSALGYRYMHDYYPDAFRFQVRLIETRQQALRISRALSGHARAIQAPMAVYIDVSPNDTDWPELVRDLATLDQINILVTIREEDLQKAGISGAQIRYESIELSLTEDEARLLYERARAGGQAQSYLSFEEAWDAFHTGGPLMEFVYLLTHTQTLGERLRQQVHVIRNRVSALPSDDELRLLRFLAVGSALGARIDLVPLRKVFPALDLEGTLARYDREYLVRWAPDERYVTGVHPIRSVLLAGLLTHHYTEPWSEAFAEVLPLIPDQDLEGLLFHAFVMRPDESEFIAKTATQFEAKTWAGLAAIGRAILWLGTKEYVDTIGALLDKAHAEFGSFASYLLNFDPLELLQPETVTFLETLGGNATLEKQQLIRNLRNQQPPPSVALERLTRWLSQTRMCPALPTNLQDWSGVAFALFWTNRLVGVGSRPDSSLGDDLLKDAAQSLALPRLAELSYALFACNKERHGVWLGSVQSTIESRLAHEYGIIQLEQGEDTLIAHFVVPIFDKPSTEAPDRAKDLVHAQTMERVHLVRQLFPGHQNYGSQGYGHRFAGLVPTEHDATSKAIPVSLLHTPGEVQPGAWYHGLAALRRRFPSWGQFVGEWMGTREDLASCLEMIQKVAVTYMRRETPNLTLLNQSRGMWTTCLQRVSEPPSLPMPAVDSWGFVYEGQGDQETRPDIQGQVPHRSIFLAPYIGYLKVLREYTTAITGFLRQAQDVTVTNYFVGKVPEKQRASLISVLDQQGLRTNNASLSIYNLTEAVVSLGLYQKEFRSRFGAIIAVDRLADIESREYRILHQLWGLWYFFAQQPRMPWADPVSQTRAKMQQEVKRIWRTLEKAFAALDGASVTVLQDIPDWDDCPTLWLRLDISGPIEIYTKVEQLIQAMHQALRALNPGDLANFIVRTQMEYVVIVPVLRGRMLDRLAWRLFTQSTLLAEKDIADHPWAYMPQPIPDSLLTALNLPLWELDRLSVADVLRTSVTEASLLAEHLADLQRLQSMSEQGGPYLSGYFASKAKEIGERLQNAIDAGIAMCNYYDEITEADRAKRPALGEAIRYVCDVLPQLFPGGQPHESGGYLLDLDGIASFTQRLTEAREMAEVVRLLWADDAIEQAAIAPANVHAGAA